ncbi:MAG: hypothetical protein AAF902_01030 [Chloroflexota bacterium]
MNTKIFFLSIVGLLLIGSIFSSTANSEEQAQAQNYDLIRVSVGYDGSEANNFSGRPVISQDGRFLVFDSAASNIVPNDVNGRWDVFVYDIQNKTIEMVSVNSNGEQANRGAGYPDISADGRYISFTSGSTNLVLNDINGKSDVFRHDRETGETIRVSISSEGVEGDEHSSLSTYNYISSNGRFISFISRSTTLVKDPPTGLSLDVYVHDVEQRETIRLTSHPEIDFSESPRLSYMGPFSYTGSHTLISGSSAVNSQIYLMDIKNNTVQNITIGINGQPANNYSTSPDISADAKTIVFASFASNLVAGGEFGRDIYIRHLDTSTTEIISKQLGNPGDDGLGESYTPKISADGNFVVFRSNSELFGVEDNQIFSDLYLYDVTIKAITNVSRSYNGVRGDGYAAEPSISGNGRYIAFRGSSTNFVPNDTNEFVDIFLVDRGPSFVNFTNSVYLPSIIN